MPMHSSHEPIIRPQLKGEPNNDWYLAMFETMPKYSKDFLWKNILQFKFLNEYHEDETIHVLATYAKGNKFSWYCIWKMRHPQCESWFSNAICQDPKVDGQWNQDQEATQAPLIVNQH